MVIARDLGKEEVLKKKLPIGPAGTIFRRIFNEILPYVSPYLTNTIPYKPLNNIAFPKMYRDIFSKGLTNK